ncbi:MAG: DEAD/DEAH box helicase [Sulfolobales archaeon]
MPIEGGKRRLLGIRAFFSVSTYMPSLIRDRLLLWSRHGVFIASSRREGEVIKRMIMAGVVFTNAPSLHSTVKRVFRGSLRDYQEEALSTWISRGYRGIISLPTGSGKTVVGVAAIASIELPALVVASTVEQVRQWSEHLSRLASISPVVVHSKVKRQPSLEEILSADVVVTTYATCAKRIEIPATRRALVIDEVHHLPAPYFRRIVQASPASIVLGLSATPHREDGKHEELFPMIGGVIYHRSAEELASKGYLAMYRVYSVPVKLHPSERREYEEAVKMYEELKGDRSFEELVEDAKWDETAREALRMKSIARQIALMSESKISAIKRIVSRHLMLGDKVIVFTEYVDQAKRLAEELGALLITGDTPARKRAEVFNRFREMQSGVLVITRVGDEGIDIPDANVGIIASGTGSRRQYIQRIGRLLRPKPGKTAVIYEVFTADTTEKFEVRRRRGITTTQG